MEESLRNDAQGLRDRIRQMADLVLKQIEDAVAAFMDSNRQVAYAVVMRDHRIDVMEHNIDRLCQEFLVRHMPVAKQLRFVVAVAKVNSELERIGDYAESMAKRAVTTSTAAMVPERARILQMSEVACQMLRHAVDAFVDGDTNKAERTLSADQQVNRMGSEAFHALAHPEQGERDLTVRFALLGLISRIERVADRACNIAEEGIYVVRGQVLRHMPRGDFRVLFLCDHNGCRSQMAEGIARTIAPSHFIFSSAGAAPTQLDPRAVAFLAREGIDISRQRPKALADVQPIEDFNVVVTLSHGAEEVLTTVPYHAVELNWDIADPSKLKVTATAAEIDAAYEAAYRELHTKVDELIDSLLGAHAELEEER
jgi:phosphate transport system protein